MQMPFFRKTQTNTPALPTVAPPPQPPIILVQEPPVPSAEQTQALIQADIDARQTLVTVLVDPAQPTSNRCDVITDVHLRRDTLRTPIGNITLAVHGGVVRYRVSGGAFVMGSLAAAALKKTNAPIERSVAITEKQITELNTQKATEVTGKVSGEASLTGVKGACEAGAALKDGVNDKQGGERSLTYTKTEIHYPTVAAPVADGVALTISPLVGPRGIERDNTGCAWPNERLFTVERTGDGPVHVKTEFRPERKFIEISDGTDAFEQIESEEQNCLIRLLLTKLADCQAWDCAEKQLLPSREAP